MSQQVFITYQTQFKDVAMSICENTFCNAMTSIDEEITESVLYALASMSFTEFFYIINSDTEIVFPDFDFSFKPPEWDKDYVHIWNNDLRVRLYNRDAVLNNPSAFSDKEIAAGNVRLKILDDKIYKYPNSDIIFISYDEAYADINFNRLKEYFPKAKRSHGVKGILEAHIAAANLATTDMFYVVDADAEIESTFEFDYFPSGYDREAVHVWYSRNPVNDLIYGYGGIKLFPRDMLLNYKGSPIDFTTSVSSKFKVIPEVSNVTRFNTDPFSAWRSGFRECTKLASKLIPNQDNKETEERLAIWCSKGADREFGEFAIMGAIAGSEYGKEHKDQPELLGLINDYIWLEKRFRG